MIDAQKVCFWPITGKAKPGPTELQKRYFINRMPPEKRPHWHTSDGIVSVGGVGSSKSFGMDVCIADILCSNPGARGLIGGIDLQLLKRNTIPVFRQFFTTIEEWDHPAILNRLSDQNNNLRFSNGSDLTLVNLTQFLKIVGVNMGVIGVEEPHLLPNVDSYHTLLGRLRNPIPEVRQIIMCTNPEKSRDGWMNQAFEMHRFKGVDTSEHPVEIMVGKPCQCQICTKCRLSYGVEIKWEKDGDDFRCPKCQACKDFWTWEGKKYHCPGDQQYTRVVRSESMHNKHLPDDFFQSMSDQYDPMLFRIMVKGETDLDIREDYVYKEFSDKAEDSNVLTEALDIDYSKDLLWALDFNLKPQCSVLCQIHETADREKYLVAKQELVMYGKDFSDPYGGCQVTDVANMFVSIHKPHYLGTKVRIYGDPHGYGGQTSRELTRYHQIYNILTANGFDVDIIADHTNIPLKERIDCVNAVCRSRILKVNPGIEEDHLSPRHLIKSLNELKWHEKIKDKLDAKGDDNARRSTNRSIVYTLTHPTDALSYLIYKEFNIISTFDQEMGVAIGGRVIVEQTPDGKVSTTYISAPEATKKAEETQADRDQKTVDFEAMMAADIERQKNLSLRDLMNGKGKRQGRLF